MRLGVAPDGEISVAQKQFFDRLKNSPRGKVAAPFQVLAETPELANAVSNVGHEIRFRTSLEPRLRELAILTVAASSGSGVEWNGHEPLARKAGAKEEEVRYARGDATPPPCDAAEATINAARSLLDTGTIENADTFVTRFGRQHSTELVVLVGYYKLLAMVMAVGGVDRDIAAP